MACRHDGATAPTQIGQRCDLLGPGAVMESPTKDQTSALGLLMVRPLASTGGLHGVQEGPEDPLLNLRAMH